MRKTIGSTCSKLAGLALLTTVAVAQGPADEPDLLCRLLFDTYIVADGMIGGPTRRRPHTSSQSAVGSAASGAWCSPSCGRMTRGPRDRARSSWARCSSRKRTRATSSGTGDDGRDAPGIPQIKLGKDVVEELLARAKNADGYQDVFVVALARARVPETRALFRAIVEDGAPDWALTSERFHAAIGLAQLGDPAATAGCSTTAATRLPRSRTRRPRASRA
jgi:hypothetical protein